MTGGLIFGERYALPDTAVEIGRDFEDLCWIYVYAGKIYSNSDAATDRVYVSDFDYNRLLDWNANTWGCRHARMRVYALWYWNSPVWSIELDCCACDLARSAGCLGDSSSNKWLGHASCHLSMCFGRKKTSTEALAGSKCARGLETRQFDPSCSEARRSYLQILASGRPHSLHLRQASRLVLLKAASFDHDHSLGPNARQGNPCCKAHEVWQCDLFSLLTPAKH